MYHLSGHGGNPRPSTPPRPRVRGSRPDAGEHVDEGNREEYDVGVADANVQNDRQDKQQLKRMGAGEVDLLAGPKAPCADHQESAEADQNEPGNGDPPPPVLNGDAVEEMHGGRNQSGRGRNGHANEILPSRPSRVARLRIAADVEAGKARDASHKKKKTDECAGLLKVQVQAGVDGIREEMKSPDEGQ